MNGLRRDIVVIGASAGGVPALLKLASSLRADFPAAIFIVLHVGAHQSLLPNLIASHGLNPAMHAIDGQLIRSGQIYIAPPDRHMLIEPHQVRLSRGAKEHHSRPAIDPLFRSAALHFGSRVIGVILSGRFDDGTAGLQAIKQRGGLAIVQDPLDAETPSMPKSVLDHVTVDYCLKVDEMAAKLLQLVQTSADSKAQTANDAVRIVEQEYDISLNQGEPMKTLDAIGSPSTFSCPECDGVLWEIKGSNPARFRCHTGHGFSLRSLIYTHKLKSEEIMWAAIRTLQEQSRLLSRLKDITIPEEITSIGMAVDEAVERSKQLRELILSAKGAMIF